MLTGIIEKFPTYAKIWFVENGPKIWSKLVHDQIENVKDNELNIYFEQDKFVS